MSVCHATRALAYALLVAMAVVTFTGRDLLGWIAAGATIGAFAVVGRLRGAGPACAITQRGDAGRPRASSSDVGGPSSLP